MPRLTLRTQLTLLYAVPFFLTGAVLLAVPLLGARSTQPAGSAGPVRPIVERGVDLHPMLVSSAVGLAVLTLVSLVLGWLVAGRFLRPLRTITATARDISARNLHRRLGLHGRRDEFGDLADTLDDLFARLAASFDAQRHFVANASHELRTPLTAERTLLQVTLADPDATAGTLRSACRDVLVLGEQQDRLIGALLTLATSEQGIERPEPFDLADITADILLSHQPDAADRGIHIDAALAPAPASGDPSLAASLVTNLVGNAVRHNAPGGRVEVATGTDAGRARLTVRNSGPVVPPDEVERLFQPFRRLGDRRLRHADGYGLGLAIVRAIADAHGATLVPRADPAGGLDIQVTFPDPRLPPAGTAIRTRAVVDNVRELPDK